MSPPPTHSGAPSYFEGLNERQREAVAHDRDPLLIIAGAGTGKTKTLVHRVARLIADGATPSRMLLMTFTRRAAQEMLSRVEGLLRTSQTSNVGHVREIWGGTFHAIATRLLRMYGAEIGLEQDFVIHDRSDSEDFVDVLRTEMGLDRSATRFPKKGTCLAIYSNRVNSQQSLADVLDANFPWCASYHDPLQELFQKYVDAKDGAAVLDYDDLLLFFRGLLANDCGESVRRRFDAVLVDEYQDTNRIQSEIVELLRPGGEGLTVVGDDAQSIYSFRAASVRNILEFPQQFPGTRIVKLEQNYRSTQSILTATNGVIAASRMRYEKELWSSHDKGAAPQLVCCFDEAEQSTFVADRVLEHREAGVALKKQAVLFRASHHALALETELTSRKIPYVKYGGLKFLEAAHIKDLLSILRLAENPRDVISGLRALQMLPGVGPRNARRLLDNLGPAAAPFDPWKKQTVPAEARKQWKMFLQLLEFLRGAPAPELPAQIHAVREYYSPCVERMYDSSQNRLQDLEQIEAIAARYGSRSVMLAEMTLDPPNSTADLAADPLLDEDYLILSTIHSAKGLEWETVFVIHAADGNIPSDMAVKNDDQVEEERRLLYVALTRARNWLYVCYPQRYYQGYSKRSNQHGYAQVSRFLQGEPGRSFARRTPGTSRFSVKHSLRGDNPEATRRSIRSGTLGGKPG